MLLDATLTSKARLREINKPSHLRANKVGYDFSKVALYAVDQNTHFMLICGEKLQVARYFSERSVKNVIHAHI